MLAFAVGERAKDYAGSLIKRHQSLGAIFALSSRELDPTFAKAPRVMALIRAARAAMLCSLKADASLSPFGDALAVVDYLRVSMSFERCEAVRILYLDAQHRLVNEDFVHHGGAGTVQLPVRDIVRAGLLHDATGFFVAHNHPSGDPTPSKADRKATLLLQKTAEAVGLVLHDHFIFASKGWSSFRALGLLGNAQSRKPAKRERPGTQAAGGNR